LQNTKEISWHHNITLFSNLIDVSPTTSIDLVVVNEFKSYQDTILEFYTKPMSMFGLARSKAFWQQHWTELRIIPNTCFSDYKGTVDCISTCLWANDDQRCFQQLSSTNITMACSSHALTHLTSLISRIGNFEAMKVDMSVKSNVIHVHDYAVKKHFTTTLQDFTDTCQLNTCSFMQTDVTVLLRTTQISQKRTLEMTFWSAEQSTAPWYAAVSWSTSLHSSGYTTASDLSRPCVASSSAARSASVI